MNRSRRLDRPFVRTSPKRHTDARSVGEPSRLAALAGRVGHTAVERLEPRQMLFSLSITADDIGADGLGTATAIFGYTIPVFTTTQEVGDNDVVVIQEGFTELGANIVPPFNVPNGFEFEETGLRIRHNVTPARDARVVADLDADGDTVEGTERLNVRLGEPLEFMSFEFDGSEDPTTDDPNLAISRLVMTIGYNGLNGLPFNSLRAVLLFDGTEVASFTGNALRDLNANPAPGNGLNEGRGEFVFDVTNPAIGTEFDQIRFEATGSTVQTFAIDDIQATTPAGNFAEIVDSRIFGAEVRFRGPVGATVSIFDLFGRDMVETIRLGIPENSNVPLVDTDDDGIPNFNDGIGQILLSNVDSRTSLTLSGGIIEAGDDDGAFFQEGFGDGAFIYNRPDEFLGLFDEFEGAGFGYAVDIDDQGNVVVTGLPPGPGSVIVGSPFDRPINNYNPAGAPPGFQALTVTDPAAFNNINQGIKILDGSSMGRINFHGALHGSSRFDGAVDALNIGYLLGSVTVAGDLGTLVVGSEAGQWVADPDFTTDDFTVPEVVKTGAELFVGRTVGEVAVAGRSLLDVTIEGDLDSPATKPPRDILRYEEKEHIVPVDENSQVDASDIFEFAIQSTTIANQSYFFGTDFLRNDTVLSAEWIGSIGTAVELTGQVGIGDPAVHTAEDPADVFAFATDGRTPVRIQSGDFLNLRVIDQDGRTLAAVDALGEAEDSQILFFDAPNPGVFYLVVSDFAQNDGDTDNGTSYRIAISGMAPTTLGAYRSGAGSGSTVDGISNTLNVLNGSVGSIRVGTGFITGGGEEGDPNEILNTSNPDVDDLLSFGAGTISVPGNLYNITAGSDIEPGSTTQSLNVIVGGNFGTLYTGLSPLVGQGPTEGDVAFLNMNIGGDVAIIDIRASIGFDQDDANSGTFLGGLQLTTGTSGQTNGNIGLIRTGNHINAGLLQVITPDGSTIGGVLISQDVGDAADAGGHIGIDGNSIFTSSMFQTGANSDIRFVDFPQIDLPVSDNASIDLIVGETIELTDDSGGRVRISITGAGTGIGTVAGLVRLLPINNSQGVAIGQIEADLSAGRTLNIRSVGDTDEDDPISIGRIEITNATALSSMSITGELEVDVWQVVQTGGEAFGSINADTPGGDIVAIDLASLNTLTIVDGDLGRTQLLEWGPDRIGPDLGVVGGLVADVGGALGIDQAAIDNDWNGELYRPTTVTATGGGTAYLDDIGSPFDPFLNGLVVRTGNVQSIDVDGAVGDVILQGNGALLLNVNVNADGITRIGGFDGIIGTIYAPLIGTVDVGDGVAPPDAGPVATTGIFASDEIGQITASDIANSNLAGYFIAANTVPGTITIGAEVFDANGIENISVDSGGDFINAVIGVHQLDGFWLSPDYDDALIVSGDISTIQGQGADFFRSQVTASDIDTFRLQGGFYDASQFRAENSANTISATGYRNSTITGTNSEFRTNSILIGESVDDITTEFPTGNMADLLIDVLGSVEGAITANNFTRVDIQVDNEIESLAALGSIRGTNITAGRLISSTIGDRLVASRLRIAGPIEALAVTNAIINSDIEVTGPSGRIDRISAPNGISGRIASSGPISNIVSTLGDIDIELTTQGNRGVVRSINAGRDLLLDADVSAGINSLIAGRHIGSPTNPGVILSRANISSVSAPNGQLYADIRAAGTIGVQTVQLPPNSGGNAGGTVTPLGVVLGRATDKPNSSNLGAGSITAFDRIGPVTINGDFDGSIISHSNGIASVTINNGSFLPGNTIAAYDGSITNLSITNGHLLGDVHADYDITLLSVAGTGVFGNIGIDPNLSAGSSVDSFRNQLPQGVIFTGAVDGPSITAGRDIVALTATGSAYETMIHAGRRIVSATIGGSFTSDSLNSGKTAAFVTAGDEVALFSVGGNLRDTLIGAGFFDLGRDNAPGGIALNTDTIKQGVVTSVVVGGSARNVDITAGLTAGNDGVYNTGDERTALGFSNVAAVSIAGAGNDVTVYADNIADSIKSNSKITTRGTNFKHVEPLIRTGTGKNISAGGTSFLHKGVSGTISFSGPGTAVWNKSAGTLFIKDSTLASSLIITADSTLTDFDIVTNDDASLGILDVRVDLAGDSDVVVDRDGGTITFDNVTGTGNIRFGGTVAAMNFINLNGGFVDAYTLSALNISGNFGTSAAGEVGIDLVNAGTIAVGGLTQGRLNVFRSATSFTSTGAVSRALLRFGDSLGTVGTGGGTLAAFSAPSVSQSRVSVGNNLGRVAVTGSVTDSAFLVGGDLGADADYGGIGLNADEASAGFSSTFTIGGNFFESDIVAGYLRGTDGFFGTSDDFVSAGRSSLGAVTIAGTGVGSNRFSESYLIASTGALGTVSIGGQTAPNTIGNFSVEQAQTLPNPIQVTNIRVVETSRLYTAQIFFNQEIDGSSISSALSVREVRGATGISEIFLVEGADYSVSYDADLNAALVTFDRDLTSRDLPRLAGVPGPGIYRFVISSDILRAQLAGAKLDGDNDGFAEPTDNFSGDAIIGDVGDKLNEGTTTVFQNGQPIFEVDYYAPINLDIVFDDNADSDGLPEANTPYTIRGTIGDHPDHDPDFFSFPGDMDLYSITLQAGQILRLGPVSGSAVFAPINIIGPSGQTFSGVGQSDDLLTLPINPPTDTALSQEQSFLALSTGRYVIAVGNAFDTVGNTGSVPDLTSIPGSVGLYEFSLEIFDDGNSGFNDVVDSGDGQVVVDAPRPSAFAGGDGILGTADDRATVQTNGFTFTLSAGPDGNIGTSDDIVSGGNGSDITSTRQGNAVTSVISSAIGPANQAGVPGNVYADVDIFHLNNQRTIPAGTLMRLTVNLSDTGGDLGSRGPDLGDDSPLSFLDFTGAVQFALFDTTNASSLDDAALVFSPTDFSPNGSNPGVIASSGNTEYGYDDDGNFFIQFVTRGAIGTDGDPATYAVYLQGVFNSDYDIEVTRFDGTFSADTVSQNVFIETRGGEIDWLQAGGILTQLDGFDPAVLGLVGKTNSGQSVRDFILDRLVDNLNDVYAELGVDVTFSADPTDFEFQDFSTVFLSSTPDPISQVFSFFDLGIFGIGGGANLSNQPFGFAEHSDALNADQNDEAVVFVPTLGQLGYTPTETDIQNLIESLTATVGRHTGELLGLRLTGSNGAGANSFDLFAADSVANTPSPNGSYNIPTIDRVLSTPLDSVDTTDFWLGRQNSGSLLEKILATV